MFRASKGAACVRWKEDDLRETVAERGIPSPGLHRVFFARMGRFTNQLTPAGRRALGWFIHDGLFVLGGVAPCGWGCAMPMNLMNLMNFWMFTGKSQPTYCFQGK